MNRRRRNHFDDYVLINIPRNPVMNNSETIIKKSFLDFMWPRILEENVCEINRENKTKFFIPEVKFDNLWAHSLLAAKCYGEYRKPLELDARNEQATGENQNELELEQMPYRTPVPTIMPLDQQLANIERDREIRKQLAYDFVNRTVPWYIQRSGPKANFQISNEMKSKFSNLFEFEILENIQNFQCQLMIIDVAIDFGLREVGRCLKFLPYVKVIAVVRNADLCRQLVNYNCGIAVTRMEDNLENSWHDELNRSLNMGIQFAKDNHLFENMAKPFVFVFANNRNFCACDKFKVLREF
ncbi:uncharacterized protein LOC101899734 [Musca domestica]|uniref:Uncharacterized protein LOC101899734 n=1 Tax=Musca domestica TaxID=7370 RepID=A0A9J7DC72_MUSDO|nr:uncharacterized protein LOC101899734 [Musca domestica]